MSQTLRSILVALVGGAALVFVLNRIVDSPDFKFPKDFLEYWASGRLNLRGENPYDAKRLLAEQRTAQPARPDAVMMWNPPPSLAVYMPLGLLPARWASLIWVGLQFAAAMLACLLLWRVYSSVLPPPLRGRSAEGRVGGEATSPSPQPSPSSGEGKRLWLAALAGLASVGTWWVVAYGQNTGVIVLGLAGFLYFRRREKPLAAGACAALTALKPHLLAGFGVLLIVEALARRGRIALAAGVSVIAVSLVIALAANAAVIEQFAAAVRDPGPEAIPLHAWKLPVPSYWLRVWLDPDHTREHFWIQFVPCAVACLALVVWRLRAGAAWDWARAMPLVVAVSVLTTPYGGWIFDLPVLLVPVVWCTARLAHSPPLLVAFLIGQALVTAISFATPGALQNYWWVAPASLALCLLGFVGKK
jgi:hypothetical protein